MTVGRIPRTGYSAACGAFPSPARLEGTDPPAVPAYLDGEGRLKQSDDEISRRHDVGPENELDRAPCDHERVGRHRDWAAKRARALPSTLTGLAAPNRAGTSRDLFCSIQFETSCPSFQKGLRPQAGASGLSPSRRKKGSVNKMEPFSRPLTEGFASRRTRNSTPNAKGPAARCCGPFDHARSRTEATCRGRRPSSRPGRPDRRPDGPAARGTGSS